MKIRTAILLAVILCSTVLCPLPAGASWFHHTHYGRHWGWIRGHFAWRNSHPVWVPGHRGWIKN